MNAYQGKKVLLLGAGAVGQVYGYHLAKAGAEVSFKVRPKYLEETRQGWSKIRLPDGTSGWMDASGLSRIR